MLALEALAAIWLAQKSLDPNFHYDSEAYHFATIRSNAELPLLPGMANLYIYYGLNQSYFLFAALLDKTSLLPMGCLITNGFLILLLSCESIYASRQLLRYPQQKVPPSALFLCLALPFVLKLGLNGLGSPTPDVLVDLLTIRYFAQLLKLHESACDELQDATNAWLIFAAAAITIKASLAGFAIAGTLILISPFKKGDLQPTWTCHRLLTPFVIGMFFLVPYLLRGVLLSGYPLFPLTIFPLPVDWRVPYAEVMQFSQYIRGFARTHEHGSAALAAAAGWQWVPDWMSRTIRTMPGPVMLATLVVALPFTFRNAKQEATNTPWRIILVLSLAFLFWLSTAPDIRFGGYLLYATSLWIWTIFISKAQDSNACSITNRLFPIGVLVVTLLLVLRTGPLRADYPSSRTFPLRSHIISPNQTINELDTDTAKDEWRIGYAPAPATFHVADDLMLRSQSLADGFRKAGHAPQINHH